jgi:hypothetical protein
MHYHFVGLSEDKTVTTELECRDISSAIENAYRLFNERSELRVLELHQNGQLIFKLERSST